MPRLPNILLASPSPSKLSPISSQIKNEFDCNPFLVESEKELHATLADQTTDILLLDILLISEEHTITLIESLRKHNPDLLILPLIPANRRDLARQILALDVFFCIHTPVEPIETSLTIKRAIEHLALHQAKEAATHTDSQEFHESFHGMIGVSAQMQELFHLITRVAEDDQSTVLIRGESGTGKEMVAKAIHTQSSRAGNNFVPVNCAAIPDDLLESELFGYTKGAFTGATANKPGRIQYADGGTLFLDEIGDMKASLQAKLLRVLQEKEFEPVGALKPTPVDTRIVAATHCDLEQLVHEGKFREDLYYRLSVVPLNIPALKYRREDIPLLIKSFINTYTVQRNREPFTFTPKALAALVHFEWRGNVRELENLIQHMSILYSGKQVDFADLPEKFMEMESFIENNPHLLVDQPSIATLPSAELSMDTTLAVNTVSWQQGQVDFKELINDFETQLIIEAMKRTEGNKKEAAKLLNLKRTTLLEKIKKKNLDRLWKN